MAKHSERDPVDLSESSIYGNQAEDAEQSFAPDDIATETTIDRLEEITGGADDVQELPVTGKLARQIDAFDASSDEEIDALKLDLTQTDERGSSRDGTGLITDDVAEERLAEFTEVGPDLADEGVISVVPGRDDTSEILRKHHPNTEIARSEAIVEGNLDEPRDEEVGERMVDEGTAG